MTRVARETGLVTQMGNNGHARRRAPPDPRVAPGRRDRAVREIHCWSRPAGQVVDPGPRPAHRDAAGPAAARLEPLAGRRARAAVPPGVSPVGLAGLVRLRHRGAGRHGHPQHGPGLLRARPRRAGGRRGRDQPAEGRIVPALADPSLRVRRARARPAGSDIDLVRRRQDARAARRTSARGVELADNGIYFVGDKGHARLRRLVGPADSLPGSSPQGFPAARRRPCPARSATAPSGSRPARTRSPPTPRPASPTPAPSPRPCWSATWPSASRNASSGMPPPCALQILPRPIA